MRTEDVFVVLCGVFLVFVWLSAWWLLVLRGGGSPPPVPATEREGIK